MNYKKILLVFIVFLSFLASGSIVSNYQARNADQLLVSHGMSTNTRYLKVDKAIKVTDFLTYVTKHYGKNSIKLQLENNLDKDQILVWANHDVVKLPTESGRYFTLDDFQGRISFAVLGSQADVTTIKTQNNQYIVLGQRYYSVLGNFKKMNTQQTKYYLSTGIQQPTAQSSLLNYRIMIDAPNKVIKELARHYHSQLKTPAFVKQQQVRVLPMIVIAGLIVCALIMIICNILLALMNWMIVKRTNLQGRLKQSWLINRGAHLILAQAAAGIAAVICLRWREFFTKPTVMVIVIGSFWLLLTLTYISTTYYLLRKENIRRA